MAHWFVLSSANEFLLESRGLTLQNIHWYCLFCAAIQVKLDELIRAGNSLNAFVGIEHLTEEELDELRAKCEQRARAEAAHRREGANSQRS